MLSKKNGIPVDVMRGVYTTKQLEIGKRLSDYGMQNESNVFLILRLKGGSTESQSIPPEKVLDDAVELSDAPDMITWDDDPENKRAKMPCGHAISKGLLCCVFLVCFLFCFLIGYIVKTDTNLERTLSVNSCYNRIAIPRVFFYRDMVWS